MKRIYTVIAAIVFLASCNHKDQQADAEKQLTAIEKNSVCATETVVLKGMYDELVLNGDVMCDEALLRKVFVPCTGRVSHLQVEVGDKVTRGQRLAVIHSEGAADYRKSLDDADAEIRMAKRQYSMLQDMHKSGMASDKEVEEAREHMLIASAERKRLHEVASINGYNGKSCAALVAPISGYVIAKSIYNDSYVDDDNNNEPAFEIADLKRVWVIADVYESDIAKVHEGTKASVTTIAYPDVVFTGKIDKVYSVLDSESKTMKVRVSINNEGGKLKPGMFANVRVSTKRNGSHLPAVPSSAVVFDNGNDYVVMRTAANKFQRRKVHVVHTAAGYSFLISGVKAGEKVVSKNALLYFNAIANE